MAPELVQLPVDRAEQVADQSRRLGAASTVRAMETLGTMLVEMRHAPDPRLLVEVAFVRLTQPQVGSGVEGLLARIENLERQIARGVPVAAGAAAPAARPSPTPPPVDPATGRARLGARAGRDTTGAVPRPAVAEPAPTPAEPAAALTVDAAPSPVTSEPHAEPERPAAAAAPAPAAAPVAASGADVLPRVAGVWAESVLPALKPIVRALYSSLTVIGPRDGAFAVAAPNDATRHRADKDRGDVEAAIAAALGARVPVLVVVADGAVSAAASSSDRADAAGPTTSGAPPEPVDESAEIDLDDLVDAPPEAVVSPLDRLTQAFPGSVLADGEL